MNAPTEKRLSRSDLGNKAVTSQVGAARKAQNINGGHSLYRKGKFSKKNDIITFLVTIWSHLAEKFRGPVEIQ